MSAAQLWHDIGAGETFLNKLLRFFFLAAALIMFYFFATLPPAAAAITREGAC